MAAVQHVFLSPHYDDAALSCGGTIARRSRAGDRVLVATIFGGTPDYAQLSPFARSIHTRPHAGTDLIDLRLAEERKALAILGARSQLYLYLDCIYRQDAARQRWLYDSEDALFGPVDAADDALVDDLERVLATLATASEHYRFYAPLAIGNHVDHQVALRSVLRLQDAGYDVSFYEDYPYVARDMDGMEKALKRWAKPNRWRAEVVAIDDVDLERKVAAVCAYRSQLGVLFGQQGNGSESDVGPALRSFGQQVAEAGGVAPYGERLWRLQR